MKVVEEGEGARPGLAALLDPTAGTTLLAALGMAALVIVGVHVGADRLDDRLFGLLSILDGAADAWSSLMIRWVGGGLDVGAGTIERAVFRVSDLIDLEAKITGSRVLALAVELCADLILVVPLFVARGIGERGALLRALIGTLRDPTLLRFVAPLAIAGAALAGLHAGGRELQSGVYTQLRELRLAAGPAAGAARVIGLGGLALMTWYLAVPAWVRAVIRSDRVAARDRAQGASAWARRLRGKWTAAVALPVVVLALIEGTPLIAGLRALWGP